MTEEKYCRRKHEIEILEREADCALAHGFYYGAAAAYGKAFSIFLSYDVCVRLAKKQMDAMNKHFEQEDKKCQKTKNHQPK